ncbi:MAG: hypothetical protein IJR96_09565 [Pseudobutyrivibrio sp.]|nr:hypothetical protein [Pseudobutyrivibrio sp.]
MNNSISSTRNVFLNIRCIVSIFCATVLVFIGGCGSDSSSSNNRYVETVQNGYLGEFTDVTVKDVLTKYLSPFYENIEWEVGTSNDNEVMVQLTASGSDKDLGFDDTIIQFTFLNEDVFKISGLQDGVGTIESNKASDVPYYLDVAYMYYYRDDFTTDEDFINGKFKDINATSVLYGASSTYDGDRKELCKLFNDTLMDMTAVELIYHYLGYSLEDVTTQDEEISEIVDATEETDDFAESDSDVSTADSSVSSVITTLSYAAGSFTGSWGTPIKLEVYTDTNYSLYSGDSVGYLSVDGYGGGLIYNAEDFSGYDLGAGWYICDGSEETMIINITDNGDGGYYVAIYHDDEYYSLIDDYVSYPFS